MIEIFSIVLSLLLKSFWHAFVGILRRSEDHETAFLQRVTLVALVFALLFAIAAGLSIFVWQLGFAISATIILLSLAMFFLAGYLGWRIESTNETQDQNSHD